MKAKTRYTLTLNIPQQQANQIIMNFLQANGYKLDNNNGYNWWHLSDMLEGHKGFEFAFINVNQVCILVYLNKENKPTPLDNSFVGCLPKDSYRNKLKTLFQALAPINMQIEEVVENCRLPQCGQARRMTTNNYQNPMNYQNNGYCQEQNNQQFVQQVYN